MTKPRFTRLEAEEMFYSGKSITQLAREHNASWMAVQGALKRAGFGAPKVSPEWDTARREAKSESAKQGNAKRQERETDTRSAENIRSLLDRIAAAEADRDYWYAKYQELLADKSPTSGPAL